jgi:hypothetical protein
MREKQVDSPATDTLRKLFGGTSSRPFPTKKGIRLLRIAVFGAGLFLGAAIIDPWNLIISQSYPRNVITTQSSGSDVIDQCRLKSNAKFSIFHEFGRSISQVPRFADWGNLPNDTHTQYLATGNLAGSISYFACRDGIAAEDFAKKLGKITPPLRTDFEIRQYGQIVALFQATPNCFAKLVDLVFEEIEGNYTKNKLIAA